MINKRWKNEFAGFHKDTDWLVPPSVVEAFIERLLEPPMSEGFEKFWKEYPNKKAKKKAYEIWNRLNLDEEAREIVMTALEAHKKSAQWTRDEGQYIPHPASWLNQHRWEDELKVEHSGSTKYKNL